MENKMKNTAKSGLIAINIVLLAVLAAVSFVPTTIGQDIQTAQNEYVAVSGMVNGRSSGVVFIASASDQAMLATTWDHNKNRIIIMAAKNLAQESATISKE
tara:strand:+ start:775 stop:1077 length:303 start_codon:yes stop_codon:yes gene_type:complete